MDDRKLSDLLGSLPREQASEDFTRGVLRRLESTESPREPAHEPQIPRRVAPWLAAAAVLLLALGLGGREWWHRHQHAEAQARYEMLREEHDALTRELRRLRSLSLETRPVIYLGGTEDVDYVYDLSRRKRDQEPSAGAPRPGLPEPSPELSELSPDQMRENPRRIY